MKMTSVISLIILVIGLQACATSEPSSEGRVVEVDTEELERQERATNVELSDYLRRLAGVTVSGSGNNVSVQIGGISTFGANTEPLYVVDGQVVGTSYAGVNNFINVRDIDTVRLLKGSAASVYGVRGANGVILIETRK